MTEAEIQRIALYAEGIAPHECGHMVVQYQAARLLGLNFLPHEAAMDGVRGVIETDTPELIKNDCVALAASLVGELICLGKYDEARITDDRAQVLRLSGEPIENFVRPAYEVIEQNLPFFFALHLEVYEKILKVLLRANSLSPSDYDKEPNRVPIMTLAEVDAVYRRAK